MVSSADSFDSRTPARRALVYRTFGDKWIRDGGLRGRRLAVGMIGQMSAFVVPEVNNNDGRGATDREGRRQSVSVCVVHQLNHFSLH